MAEESLKPGLYMIATPIGNLGDITLRAIDTLTRCDAVACEDTRVTGKLLKHLGIRKPMVRYDDHSDENVRDGLIARMADSAVALVSDAGTPLVSDPGYRLVKDAREAGIFVTALPGPCAAIAGLSLSGMPTDRFLFAGFLPVKEKARGDALSSVADVDATLIFYETAHRLLRSLTAIDKHLPGRRVAVARELTKFFEETRTGTPEELIRHYEDAPAKGEIVLLVAPPSDEEGAHDTDALLREFLKSEKPSQAAKLVAQRTGADRKNLYARALELRSE